MKEKNITIENRFGGYQIVITKHKENEVISFNLSEKEVELLKSAIKKIKKSL